MKKEMKALSESLLSTRGNADILEFSRKEKISALIGLLLLILWLLNSCVSMPILGTKGKIKKIQHSNFGSFRI